MFSSPTLTERVPVAAVLQQGVVLALVFSKQRAFRDFATEMPAVSGEAWGRWRREGGGSARHDGTARVVLLQPGDTDCYSKFCESALVTRAKGRYSECCPRRSRRSHPSQFPKHMCVEQEINQRSSSKSQNNLGVKPASIFLSFFFRLLSSPFTNRTYIM